MAAMSASTDSKTTGRPPSKASAERRDTPAMRQFRTFKQQHPDCVLFFRMGDFYEMFEDDAVLTHKVLGITLTQRTEGIPMAGVPYHAVEGYLRRMIEAGYRVAVCDQVQDPKDAKGVVDRAVTRVVTPGTLVDENLLDAGAANVVAAIMFTEAGEDSPAVLGAAELSTGSFTVCELAHDRIVDELARLAPSELLYVETADGNTPPRVEAIRSTTGCSLTARPGWSFRISDAGDLLREHFSTRTLAGFGLEDDALVLGPAGALLRYLLETQTPYDDGTKETVDGDAPQRPLGHLQPPKRSSHDDAIMLDAASLRSLEIERTMRTGQVAGSLLSVLQQCATPMGRRLLRQWLCYPSRRLAVITQRQEAVAAFVADRERAADLAEHLGRVQDVARIVGRVALGRVTPRDILALARSLSQLSKISELLDACDAFMQRSEELTTLGEALLPVARTITQKCVEEPPVHLRDGGIFRDGVDSELDAARALQRDANTWLAAYQKQLIDSTGINSLKVGYNKVFGYYIEVTHAHTSRVPETFTRKQTLKNAERYITPQLKEFEDKVTTAEARAIEREKVLFAKLCALAGKHTDGISRFGSIIAELDVLWCFAENAVRQRFVRPAVVDEPVLKIVQGRHPVLDLSLRQQFVPNDCVLGLANNDTDGDEQDRRTDERAVLALITGPNMAGKSTYIRQVALITLLAHAGSFVPAEVATIGLTDRIFTRIGASDELHAGQSTFMVEMTETANILHHATPRSLVILDEIGRGTSTLDGLSLAWAITETLADIGCRTMFATHYHELTDLADQFESVTNLHVAVREWNDDVVFLYRIQPGRADQSYGVHVAKIAGVPKATIERAKVLLKNLSVHSEVPSRSGSLQAARPHAAQMNLFTEYVEHPALQQLRDLDLDDLSPMQAFDALRRLRERIDSAATGGDSP